MIASTNNHPPAGAANFRTSDERLIKVTPSAAKRVSTLLQKQGRANGVLRVSVVGGGCSGLQYKMDLQDGPANRDFLVETCGVRVVVDPQERSLRHRQRAGLPGRVAGRIQSEEPECGHELFLRREF